MTAQFDFLWNKIRERARALINPISYSTFIEHLVPVDVVNKKLVLRAASELTARTIVKNHLEKLCEAASSAGIGLTGGYVFSLGKRWNLELSGSFGLLWFRQKQYYVHDNYDDYFVDEAVKTNARGYKLFPVKLGVTFSYIIK